MRIAAAAGWLILCFACIPTCVQAAESLQWSITPYLWASQTKVDLEFRGDPVGGDTISFNDLLDQLDTAFMIHAEAGRGNWSAFADLTYLETSDTRDRPVLEVAVDSEVTVLDAGMAWWPGGVGSSLSVIGGMRYSGFDDRYRVNLEGNPVTTLRNTNDYYDALLGVRYRFDLGERWALMTHADYSMGDSEGTWLIRANLAWTVGKRRMNRLVLGYQFKEAEFESGDVRTDYSYHGPMAGFNFRF
jgi:hypothetical protein